MGDAGSERSKAPSLPPRCPCGFWGCIMPAGILADTHDHKVSLMYITETLVPNVLIYGKFKEYVTKLTFEGPPEIYTCLRLYLLGFMSYNLRKSIVTEKNLFHDVKAFHFKCEDLKNCVVHKSSKTMNLCSKCFAEKRNPHNEKDFQKKQPDDDSTPSTSNNQSDLYSGETNSDNSNTSLTTQAANSNQQLLTELNVTSPSKEECGPCTSTAHASLTTPTKRSCDSDSQSESEASPVKRPRLLDDSNDRPEETSRSKQKSRRRCFQCQTKLELVQQELGSCRCGYVFCMLHRLPEQHDCTFDHMGRGREEAIMKMVKLDRKVGRSCQRIGEGCS
ncbi:an1-type zinc finger protein 3 [Limosa lapponica baueri]|uniref:An1-type zinc finger protein 3 n=2 Tax=Scolopacidae TaxID=8917 RepID=A0A2I0UM94_LIMLA|nr:an1-type zinc finger protein 3 [Limosa lapponica baueri]